MIDWKELFDRMDNDSTSKAISILNERGILTDEDFAFVTRGAYREGKKYFMNYLFENGYVKGELDTHAKYFEDHGQIDAIFDIDRWDYSEVNRYLEKVKESKKH